MEILRVPPYPITTTWDVPEANADYTIYVEDVVDHSIETLSVTSNSSAQITYTLPRSKVQFDRDFLFRVYDIDLDGEIVVDSNLTVYRPYVDPNLLGTTQQEILDYKKWEIVARAIMDSYLGNDSGTGEGFYNHKLIVQGVGEGNDYFPMWHNPKKILKVYENNQIVFNGEDTTKKITNFWDTEYDPALYLGLKVNNHDYAVGDNIYVKIPALSIDDNFIVTELLSSGQDIGFRINIKANFTDMWVMGATVKRVWNQNYVITPNNSAIMRVETDMYNRYEQTPLRLPIAYGDVGPYGLAVGSVAFPKGYDYIFVLDVGYKAVPPDIEQAAMKLINDLKCGNNDYYKRFVTQYDTDQFSIKYSAAFLGGTGNNIVDKILDGYKGDVIKPGIL